MWLGDPLSDLLDIRAVQESVDAEHGERPPENWRRVIDLMSRLGDENAG